MRLRADRRPDARGQSVVEFALVLPIMLVLMLAIVDFARVFTTMLTVESGAREAADYAAFGSYQWNHNAPGRIDQTVAEMQRRACTATSSLPDYQRPSGATDHTTCLNPAFSYALCLDPMPDPDPTCTVTPDPYAGDCYDASTTDPSLPPKDPPCTVTVTLTYDFRLFAPLNIEMFGVTYGFPNTLTFQRSSMFAMSDLALP